MREIGVCKQMLKRAFTRYKRQFYFEKTGNYSINYFLVRYSIKLSQ